MARKRVDEGLRNDGPGAGVIPAATGSHEKYLGHGCSCALSHAAVFGAGNGVNDLGDDTVRPAVGRTRTAGRAKDATSGSNYCVTEILGSVGSAT